MSGGGREGFEEPPPPGRDIVPAEDIEKMFASLLGQASAKKRVVVLVDALNQFERTIRGRHLTWLPRPWPGNARLVTTAIGGDESESLVRTDLGRRCELRRELSVHIDRPLEDVFGGFVPTV